MTTTTSIRSGDVRRRSGQIVTETSGRDVSFTHCLAEDAAGAVAG